VQASTNVDHRFLTYFSDLLVCSRCLRFGRRTPVRQVISPRHRPQTLCRDCRSADARAGH
jgi:hypothetical protein